MAAAPDERVEALRSVYARWAQGDFRAGQDLLAADSGPRRSHS
jgi:hypothetical protein